MKNIKRIKLIEKRLKVLEGRWRKMSGLTLRIVGLLNDLENIKKRGRR